MPQERVRGSTVKARPYGRLPFGSNLAFHAKTDGSNVHHDALNARGIGPSPAKSDGPADTG